ncbi:MAG: transcriptional regulator with XRE-family HTH domain [Rickettsiales bacterium]|jgi:transcriptional regulator with XRE-family HTH domain
MHKNVLTRRLSEEMKKQKWTGRKLSTKANLSYNAVHYILNGKTKSTNFEAINAIAEVLGVSPFYLLDEKHDKNSTNTKTKEDIIKETSTEEIPYDGQLYRQVMLSVEEVLASKNNLTTQRIEYFTHYIYSQIKKMNPEDQEKDVKSYAEGIIDYALNRMQ